MIPRRFHARLYWIGFLWNQGWAKNEHVWEDLLDLAEKIGPFLDDEDKVDTEEIDG